MVTDKLEVLKRGDCRLEGYLGKRIDDCIENGIMATDYQLFTAPFKNKTDDNGDWGGEFFGKWYTSAALAYKYRPEEKYLEIINSAIEELKESQEKSGRLSASKKDFANWDIWGRKYSILALLSHYEQTCDKTSLLAASKSVDNIIEIAGKGEKKLTETGLRALEALSSCSILEPVVLLYRYTENEKYLNFAEYIISLWSEPNTYTDKGMKLMEDALEGKEPIYISVPKGYEMMSCYEGICELYRATGNKKYLDAVIKFAKLVIDKEIMIVGSGSSCELWCDGKKRQTELLEHPMETCVTVTWIKLCYQLLRLTGESLWTDQMEITLYNSLLAAIVPGGSWWAYYSPLQGVRKKSHIQMSYVKSSCCVVNGPRGLMTVPQWGVMKSQKGPVINLYNKGSYRFDNNLRIDIDTMYPENNGIKIKAICEKSQNYTFTLRIPYWSKKTELFINGIKQNCNAGSYAQIKRNFNNGDEISLKLDMRGRIITSWGSVNYKAVMCGPVVLALDNRLVEKSYERLWIDDNNYRFKHSDDWNIDYFLLNNVNSPGEIRFIDLVPCTKKPDYVWIAYEVPFMTRTSHFFNHKKKKLVMCDYSSAGNDFSNENALRVWFPQPMPLSIVFPEDTGEICNQSL